MVIAILRSCHPDKNCHDDYTVIENVDSGIHSQFRAHTEFNIISGIPIFVDLYICTDYVRSMIYQRIRKNPNLPETTKIAIHEFQLIYSSIARY